MSCICMDVCGEAEYACFIILVLYHDGPNTGNNCVTEDNFQFIMF